MGFLIGALIGALISAALSAAFGIICIIFNFNTKQLNFYTQQLLYSLLIAIISFMSIILIKTW